MEEVKVTNKGKISKLKLYTPNSICAFRSSTFHTKEPEMLEWIDGW